MATDSRVLYPKRLLVVTIVLAAAKIRGRGRQVNARRRPIVLTMPQAA